MTLYEFIFSKRKPARYFRHITFWLLRYLFIVQMIFGSMYFFRNLELAESVLTATTFGLYAASAEMIFTYSIVYWLIPRFFKTNKLLFITGLIALSALLVMAESPVYIKWFQMEGLPKYSFGLIWECAVLTTSISHVICLLFIACKLFKNYYLTMEERETLASENARAEIQLLKAQVHPHFLFNTLNNIYSFALRKSPYSADLVLKLTDTLRYMINDCEAPLVAVSKEIKFIEDYIGLEKVRYGNRLDLQLEINGNYQNKLIAPLLLIPFVENSFKHGAGKSLKHRWIKLEISIKESILCMNLRNSKPLEPSLINNKNGIGLKNVQKRLQILYSNDYELRIEPTEEEFFIQLEIPLQTETSSNFEGLNVHPFSANNQNKSYA